MINDANAAGSKQVRLPFGSWFRERPWLIDLVVILAVFAYNLPIQQGFVPSGLWVGTGIVVSLGLCVPYFARRRYPLVVFSVTLLVALVQLMLGIGLIVADAMMLFCLYNLASRLRWTITIPAAAILMGWLSLAVTPLLVQNYISAGNVAVFVVLILWAWTWGTLVKVRSEYIESLQERARQLEKEQVTQAKIVAAEERARIARDIHDIVSHSLSVVVVLAEGATSTVDSEPDRAKVAMTTVRDTGRAALADMRRMLGVLRHDEPGSHSPQPGIARLQALIDESKLAGFPVELIVIGTPVDVSASLDLAVYRVVQEALTNIRKHAGPSLSRAEVELHYRDTELEIRITDDGQGFGSHTISEGSGHGLVGMQERVAAYAGTLRAGMRPSGGFEVVAMFPIEGAQ